MLEMVKNLMVDVSLVFFIFLSVSMVILFVIRNTFFGKELIKNGEFEKLIKKIILLMGWFLIVIILANLISVWDIFLIVSSVIFSVAILFFLGYFINIYKFFISFIKENQHKIQRDDCIKRDLIKNTKF